jgi:hypothetical protein
VLGEQRVEQLALVREPSVRGTDTDAGVSRDVVESDLEALLGEELPGGGQQTLPVLCGIAAQSSRLPRRRGFGHPLTLPDAERQPPYLMLRCFYSERSSPLIWTVRRHAN